MGTTHMCVGCTYIQYVIWYIVSSMYNFRQITNFWLNILEKAPTLVLAAFILDLTSISDMVYTCNAFLLKSFSYL